MGQSLKSVKLCFLAMHEEEKIKIPHDLRVLRGQAGGRLSLLSLLGPHAKALRREDNKQEKGDGRQEDGKDGDGERQGSGVRGQEKTGDGRQDRFTQRRSADYFTQRRKGAKKIRR